MQDITYKEIKKIIKCIKMKMCALEITSSKSPTL